MSSSSMSGEGWDAVDWEKSSEKPVLYVAIQLK